MPVGVVRFICNRIKEFHDRGETVPQQWVVISALLWSVDRSRFRYHRGCGIDRGWKVEVNAYKHEELHGMSRQANEHVFSMMDRWHLCLNACPQTNHLLL